MNKGCICEAYKNNPNVNLLIKILDAVQYSPSTGKISGMYNAEKGEVVSIYCYYCGNVLWKGRRK